MLARPPLQDVSMPFKTGKGYCGLPSNRSIDYHGSNVSMPFKTGKGTAGLYGGIVVPARSRSA